VEEPAQRPPPPKEFFALFRWFYIFMGGCIVLAGFTNLISGFFILQRRGRLFSLIVAGFNCLCFPFGTVLGVFTFMSCSASPSPRPTPPAPPAASALISRPCLTASPISSLSISRTFRRSTLVGRGKSVHVTLLIGKKQTKLDLALVQQMRRVPDQVELVEVGASGHNALDLTLAYYLGRAAERSPARISASFRRTRTSSR